MSEVQQLLGLFLSAFLSATILPGTSEAVMVGILTLGTASAAAAVTVATIGNTAGSLVNWAIGRYFAHWRDHPRFPLSKAKFERYSEWFRRFGVWALFLSWVPLAGDALTIIAGLARVNPLLVAAIVFIAKGLRYIIVAAGVAAVN